MPETAASNLDIREVGRVKEVRHGIVKAEGLPSCSYGQLVKFSNDLKGMVIGYNPQEVLVIVLGDEAGIAVGDSISHQSDLASMPVGEGFLGRVVNSLGEPLDRDEEIRPQGYFPIFREAVGFIDREPISQQLLTGIKAIDLVIPVGKGQRELIIGDRQTGKSSLAVDAVMNQKGKDVICIYCWIGGPQRALKKHILNLSQVGAMDYTIVVSASADASAAEQYLAPYSACALGEYFMHKGKDVLVVFDDLTKHAWIYRQISLLLERSPGREAYPGDIFYLHSQIMERAGKLKKEKSGGSMTFLPIAETLQGDISGYIQTNLISMTDGQLYLNSALFREGFKPAIDLGLSVSRIGNKVQCPAMKEVGDGLRLEYAQYRQMLRLTKLRTRLSNEVLEKIQRGDTLREILMQPNNNPIPLEEEIILFYAFKRKILEAVPKAALKRFMEEFFDHLLSDNAQLIDNIKDEKSLTPHIKEKLDEEFVEFFRSLRPEGALKR